MKHTLIIITFIVALGCANAQERLFYDTPCDGITTDIQGNLFLFHDDNLERIAADGTKQLSYGEPTFGNIAQVDANIASKLLVYYRENGTIILLNNELAPIGNPLNLFDKSLMTVTLAAMGNPNTIVLYDEANQELILTDLNLNVSSRTHVAFPGEFRPTDMQVLPEHRIALLDNQHGICLFDFYGTFEREIPIPGITAMQLMKDQIIFLKDKTLYQYTLPSETTTLEIKPLDMEMPDMKTFHIRHHFLYYIDNQDVAWKIQL